MNTNQSFDALMMAPDNELADAREIREAFLERLGPINPVQAFYVNYLVRGAVTTIRAEMVETFELTRAARVIQQKLEDASEPLDTRLLQALAIRALSLDQGRLEDLLRSQNWGSREVRTSLRDLANSSAPQWPPDMPSCMQDLVQDSGPRFVAPPLLKAA